MYRINSKVTNYKASIKLIIIIVIIIIIIIIIFIVIIIICDVEPFHSLCLQKQEKFYFL
jgi:putative copper export protein